MIPYYYYASFPFWVVKPFLRVFATFFDLFLPFRRAARDGHQMLGQVQAPQTGISRRSKAHTQNFRVVFLRFLLRLAEITFWTVDEPEDPKPCAFQERPHLPFFGKEIVGDGRGAHVVLLDFLAAQGMRDDQVSIPLQYPVHLLQGQRLGRKMGEGPETDDMVKKFVGERERFDG